MLSSYTICEHYNTLATRLPRYSPVTNRKNLKENNVMSNFLVPIFYLVYLVILVLFIANVDELGKEQNCYIDPQRKSTFSLSISLCALISYQKLMAPTN